MASGWRVQAGKAWRQKSSLTQGSIDPAPKGCFRKPSISSDFLHKTKTWGFLEFGWFCQYWSLVHTLSWARSSHAFPLTWPNLTNEVEAGGTAGPRFPATKLPRAGQGVAKAVPGCSKREHRVFSPAAASCLETPLATLALTNVCSLQDSWAFKTSYSFMNTSKTTFWFLMTFCYLLRATFRIWVLYETLGRKVNVEERIDNFFSFNFCSILHGMMNISPSIHLIITVSCLFELKSELESK